MSLNTTNVRWQLSTARFLVAQFEQQLAELAGMNRAQRRGTDRGRDLVAREAGMREGLAKWTARAAELEPLAAQEDAAKDPARGAAAGIVLGEEPAG